MEELELFEELELEQKDEESSVVINGDVIISVNNCENVDSKEIRSKITKNIKNQIKRRDSHVCQCCGRKFENHLEVHHIMPLSRYPMLACIPENLISLCQQCHKRYHNLNEGNEGAVSFATFLKQYGR